MAALAVLGLSFAQPGHAQLLGGLPFFGGGFEQSSPPPPQQPVYEEAPPPPQRQPQREMADPGGASDHGPKAGYQRQWATNSDGSRGAFLGYIKDGGGSGGIVDIDDDEPTRKTHVRHKSSSSSRSERSERSSSSKKVTAAKEEEPAEKSIGPAKTPAPAAAEKKSTRKRDDL